MEKARVSKGEAANDGGPGDENYAGVAQGMAAACGADFRCTPSSGSAHSASAHHTARRDGAPQLDRAVVLGGLSVLQVAVQRGVTNADSQDWAGEKTC